jgi:hypothetical protein
MSSFTRMNKANVKIFILSMIMLLISTNSHAQYLVSITSSHLFGDTNYRFDALTVNQQAPYDTFPIASKLEFPLNVWLVGASVDWRLPGGKWELAASVAMNLSDPSHKMTDSDWQRGRKIQYTESDADLNMVNAALNGRRRLFIAGQVPIKLIASVHYQHISEDMTGYEGWYYSYTQRQELPISGTDPAMKYKVDYCSPQAGLAADLPLSFGFTLNARSTAGVVFAWDKNDHLLRGKRSEGNATGFGMHSAMEVSGSPFRLGTIPIMLGLRGDFLYFSADGTSTQTWYRDEGDITAGTVIRDLPHEFKSTQYMVGIMVGTKW